jgi:DNA-binding LytR/AlgR family response regulator
MIDTAVKKQCRIVDDEQNAINILQEYLGSFGNLLLAGTARNAFDALSVLRSNKIDLMFLDIQMPQITGMQLLETIPDPPAVIITTAHRDYAIDAFDFQVLDYLLKPISFERFAKSVNRFLDSVHEPTPPVITDECEESYLVIRSDRKDIRIPLQDILYLQAMGDYVVLVSKSGEKHLTLETLSHIYSRLPENEFARIHRSYIVNKRHIRAIGKDSVETGNSVLPFSRTYRPIM